MSETVAFTETFDISIVNYEIFEVRLILKKKKEKNKKKDDSIDL